MNEKRQVLIVFFTTLVIYVIVVLLNNILSRYSIHLSLDSLYLLFPGLYMLFWPGYLIVALIALLVDALIPLPFGTLFVLYSLGYLIIRQFNTRFRKENRAHVMFIAFIINSIIMLIIALIMGRNSFFEGNYWLRFITDLFLSGLVLILIAPLILELQRLFLQLSGVNMTGEAIND
jgi:hypothetical protein